MSNSIENIIWDFDGVIFFSEKIRIEGFKYALVGESHENIDEFLEFHAANGGLSRYDKFERFIQKNSKNEEEIEVYLRKYSEYMNENLFDEALKNHDVIEFIKNNKQYKHFIASASDEKELISLCYYLNIYNLFDSILGSPLNKNKNVSKLILENQLCLKNTILIGDAINDEIAANHNGIKFVPYNNIILEANSKSKIIPQENLIIIK